MVADGAGAELPAAPERVDRSGACVRGREAARVGDVRSADAKLRELQQNGLFIPRWGS